MSNIALVGYTGTDYDHWMEVKSWLWINKFYPTVFEKLFPKIEIDEVCLPDRDFLMELKEYDIVVVCNISRHRDISPYHNRASWRQRLMRTKAKFIFLFGESEEVTGVYVGKLADYEVSEKSNPFIYVHNSIIKDSDDRAYFPSI